MIRGFGVSEQYISHLSQFMVYLPTFTIHINQMYRQIYQTLSVLGMVNYLIIRLWVGLAEFTDLMGDFQFTHFMLTRHEMG